MPRLILFTVYCGLLSSACVTPGPVRPVELAREQYFNHLTPRQLGFSVRAEQKIEANYGQKGGTFIAVLEVTPEKMTIVSATATGQRLFTLQLLEDGSLDFESGMLEITAIKPEYIVADIQLVFWPTDAVREGLRGSNLSLRVKEIPRMSREILLDGRPILEINYSDRNPWRGSIVFRNFDRNYTFTIVNGDVKNNR